MIFLVSDGVYDNVDPEHLGLTPAQVFEPDSLGAKYSEWDAIPIDICVEKKEQFKIEKIRSLYYSPLNLTHQQVLTKLIYDSQCFSLGL